jgi:hypothetical protein
MSAEAVSQNNPILHLEIAVDARLVLPLLLVLAANRTVTERW